MALFSNESIILEGYAAFACSGIAQCNFRIRIRTLYMARVTCVTCSQYETGCVYGISITSPSGVDYFSAMLTIHGLASNSMDLAMQVMHVMYFKSSTLKIHQKAT